MKTIVQDLHMDPNDPQYYEHSTRARPGELNLTQEEIDNWEFMAEPSGPSAYKLLLFLLFFGITGFLWGNEYHLVDRYEGMGPFTVILSIGMAIGLFAYLLRRDGIPENLEFGTSPRGGARTFAVILFLLLPFALGVAGISGFTKVFNCLLDFSHEQTMVVAVPSQEFRFSKMDYGKRSWVRIVQGDAEKWIPVPDAKLDSVRAAGFMKVTTRAGMLGAEWVSNVEPEFTGK